VGHGLDPGGIHRLHLLDEAEDAVELGLVAGGLVLGHPDAGQFGDAFDVVDGERHGISALIEQAG
jgi:hypothetical protein